MAETFASKHRRRNGVSMTSGAGETRELHLSHAARAMLRNLPPNERVEVKQDTHFNECKGSNRGATREEVQEIRDLQAHGLSRRQVSGLYLGISECSFNNIWSGVTAAGVVGNAERGRKLLEQKSARTQ